QAARDLLEKALAGWREQNTKPLPMIPLFAVLVARAGRKQTALEWLGCARAQTTLNAGGIEWYLHFHRDEIQSGLTASEVEAALARGATMRLEDVLQQFERRGEGVGTPA